MSTNAEVIELAMSRLGQRASTRLRADVLAEINASINSRERAPWLPWFLRDSEWFEYSDFAFAPGFGTATLDSAFLRERESTRVYRFSATDFKYTFLTRAVLGLIHTEQDATTQTHYDISGLSLQIAGVPVDNGDIYVIHYYKAQTGNLVDDGSAVSNLWLINAQDYILAHALRNVADFHVQNTKLASRFALQQQEAFNELYAYHESLEHENTDYFVGGSSDGS